MGSGKKLAGSENVTDSPSKKQAENINITG